jgi:selenocysteine lyase/cysteine desulfurase
MLNARQHFPGALDKTYLDAACISLAPRPAVEAVEKFLDLSLTCPYESATAQHIAMDELRGAARPIVARLLNAHQDEIALVESTSHALAIAAEALPLESGDRILISDLEFMEVAIPWMQKQKDGIAIDVVPNVKGEVRAEDFAARLTPKTRAMVLSSVQWSNGYRCDLAAFSRLCRDRGIFLVVDAIQQLGAVPINVRETPIDLLACGGHKWLNAPFGCGFLYINREIQQRLRPPIAGYLSLCDPVGGWGAYFQTPTITPVSDYAYVQAARRYEAGGTANYPGAVGLAASVSMILNLGQQNVAEHVHGLTDRLVAGLERLPVKVITPREHHRRAGIVTFSVGDADANVTLMNRLLEQRILVSVRYTSNVGGVRISCHLFNSDEDVDRVLESVGRLMR